MIGISYLYITCWPVIPILKASRTLSLVKDATTMFGNLNIKSEKSASKLIFKFESV